MVFLPQNKEMATMDAPKEISMSEIEAIYPALDAGLSKNNSEAFSITTSASAHQYMPTSAIETNSLGNGVRALAKSLPVSTKQLSKAMFYNDNVSRDIQALMVDNIIPINNRIKEGRVVAFEGQREYGSVRDADYEPLEPSGTDYKNNYSVLKGGM